MSKTLPQRPYRPFQFALPTTLLSGAGQSEQLVQHPLVQKHERIALITDQHLQNTPYFEACCKPINDRIVFIDAQTVPDSSVDHINTLGERVRSENVTLLIAIGGGSVMDTAKCAAVVAAKEGHIQDHAGYERVRTQLMPLLCIPTTAGTGAESTQFAVIKNHEANKKLVYVDKALIPTATILDPNWLKTVPRSVIIATGVDALTHAVEAIASKLCNPYGEAWALRAIEMLIAQNALTQLANDRNDENAAYLMMTAANLAGHAISTCMLGACHAMAHALGALHSTPHGIANGLCLTTVMKLNQTKAQSAYAQIGWALGGRGDAAELAQYSIERLEEFIHETMGVPRTLNEIGIKETAIDALAQEAFTDMDLMTNPVKIKNPDELAQLFQSLN